ncbi:MAG: TraB/GumN family protein [Verrucomicrobiales bacterium]
MTPFHRLLIPALSCWAVGSAPVLLAAENDVKSASIWKVSDEDSSVYLAGSVHLLREKDMPIPPIFDEVYAVSDELIFEIDMAAMTDPAIAVKMRALGSLPAGENLGDRFSEETMTKLESYLSERNFPRGLFDRFTPGMVFLTLSSIEATRNGARPDLGLESQFYLKSEEDGKPSRGLETPEYQMSRFDEIDPENLEALVNESLDDIDQAEESLDEIISAWKTGDGEKIAELILEEMASGSPLREVLLTERNKNWIPIIEESLAGSDTVLFIVGAAHLVGEDSVVELLQKKGHEVSQLEFED